MITAVDYRQRGIRQAVHVRASEGQNHAKADALIAFT